MPERGKIPRFQDSSLLNIGILGSWNLGPNGPARPPEPLPGPGRHGPGSKCLVPGVVWPKLCRQAPDDSAFPDLAGPKVELLARPMGPRAPSGHRPQSRAGQSEARLGGGTKAALDHPRCLGDHRCGHDGLTAVGAHHRGALGVTGLVPVGAERATPVSRKTAAPGLRCLRPACVPPAQRAPGGCRTARAVSRHPSR